MEIEKKEKVKKILTRVWLGVTTFLSGLFVVAVAVGCSQKGNKQANAYYDESEYQYSYRYDYQKEYRKPQQAVVYNDEEYVISLNSNELNVYIWNNLATYMEDDNNLGSMFVSYYSETFDFDELQFTSDLQDNVYGYYIDIDETGFTGSLWLNYGYDTANPSNVFVLRDENESSSVSFDGEVHLLSNVTYYASLKQAIELDIQANTAVNPTDFVNDIFADVTASITGFVGSVGSGIVSMTALFYDSANSQLTTLGLLSVIVVAVSLAYWLFRLIIGLIRMRG